MASKTKFEVLCQGDLEELARDADGATGATHETLRALTTDRLEKIVEALGDDPAAIKKAGRNMQASIRNCFNDKRHVDGLCPNMSMYHCDYMKAWKTYRGEIKGRDISSKLCMTVDKPVTGQTELLLAMWVWYDYCSETLRMDLRGFLLQRSKISTDRSENHMARIVASRPDLLSELACVFVNQKRRTSRADVD